MRLRFAALLLFVLLAGCVRHHAGTAASKGVPGGVAGHSVDAARQSPSGPKPSATAGGPPPPQPPASVAATERPATRPQQPSPLVLHPVPEQSPGAVGAATTLSGTAALLPLTAEAPLYPSDYEIGPLQPYPSGRAAVDAIYRVAEEFFGELAKGKVDSALLDPSWRTVVERFLSYPIRQQTLPESVRIGIISIQGDRASAPVRFTRGEGRTSGRLYFDEVDRTWYLSDIQAAFGRLAQPFVRTEQYRPESWQWLLSR